VENQNTEWEKHLELHLLYWKVGAVLAFLVAFALFICWMRSIAVGEMRLAFAMYAERQYPIQRMLVQDQTLKFVWVEVAGSGGYSQFAPANLLPFGLRTGEERIGHRVILDCVDAASQYVVFRKPTADEAEWVKLGKPNPGSMDNPRIVAEVHAWQGSMPGFMATCITAPVKSNE